LSDVAQVVSDNAHLQVVNASAGSGKTYSLVKTYIQLLLIDHGDKNDRKYAEILAMTFTNKAALEMKTRIVKALDELAYPTLHGDAYLQTISNELQLKSTEVQKKAQRLLTRILHQYEDFHVMTIDKFNLRLIRSFSYDLDLPTDMEVVLDETPVIEMVIDQMLDEVGRDPTLSNLIFRYAQANVEQEKSWNIRNSLIEFGKILTKEHDLPYVDRLMNMEFSVENYQQHRTEIRQVEQQYNQKSLEIVRFFESNGFAFSDFAYGKDIENALNRLRTPKVNWTDEFPFKQRGRASIAKASDKHGGTFAQWATQIELFYQWYAQQQQNMQVLQKFLANYFNMALLKYINNALVALNKQERLIRISEFNTKISELLQEDTPYIYEKLGTRFRHFMLDEFQDTSRLQWLNLIPLLEESIAKGDTNFIVGDPKQAIYRFKNGVAEQFVELPGIYNPENDLKLTQKSAFFQQMGAIQVLEDNWRSAPEIVAFNNRLFEELKGQLTQQHQEFYRSVHQHPKSRKNGYVCVKSCPKQTAATKKENALQFILHSINEVLADGFRPTDICILGRGNKFCNFVAFELTQRGFSVVSADSLNIDSEITVRFVISYLHVRLHPKNPNRIRQFAHLYCELFDHSLAYYISLFPKNDREPDANFPQVNLDVFFERNPQLKDHFFDPFDSLYGLLQQTFRLFELKELDNPYIHHLADLVHLFERRKGPDLQLLLQEYPTMPKETKALQIPESEHALKIMTIHKSKGLEFPVVIVINDMESNVKNEFFVQTNDYLLRSTLAKTSAIEAIQLAYEEETSKLSMDTLNLYYVAYTRATTRLYIHNEYTKNGLSGQMHTTLNQLYDDYSQELYLEIGSKNAIPPSEKSESNLFVPTPHQDNLWFPEIALHDSATLDTESSLSEERRYGNQFHLLVARMDDRKNALVATIDQLIHAGQIELDFRQRLLNDMNLLLSNDEYLQLFKNHTKILNERTVIASRTQHVRPDKIIVKPHQTIVVEYKTGKQNPTHLQQLQDYCSLVRQMKFPNTIGYLVYVWEGKLTIKKSK